MAPMETFLILKRMRIFLLPLLIVLLFSACASTPLTEVTVAEPDRIRFHGKGAGAGMMLMSSMGPMGIAVGVAIDEGIGKDINKVAKEVGFNIQTTLLQHLPAKYNITSITIERYGFVLRSGKNDPAAPQLHISVTNNKGETTAVKYPEEFDATTVATYPLDELKLKGELTLKAFNVAIPKMLSAL